MSYLKFNLIKYSDNDDGTFWPGVVEVPEDKLFNNEDQDPLEENNGTG